MGLGMIAPKSKFASLLFPTFRTGGFRAWHRQPHLEPTQLSEEKFWGPTSQDTITSYPIKHSGLTNNSFSFGS
jgi:hypothetical protein